MTKVPHHDTGSPRVWYTYEPKAECQPMDADAKHDPGATPHGEVRSRFNSMPGGMLSISANGDSDGIVWATAEEPYSKSTKGDGCDLSTGEFVPYCDATMAYVPGRLYAFDATPSDVGTPFGQVMLPILWGDTDTGSKEPNNRIEKYAKFTPPTIAHGMVIVATANGEVLFYGLK